MSKNQLWLDALHIPEGFPNIVCGWPAEEIGTGFDDYIEHFKGVLDDMREGDAPPVIPPYLEWRDAKIEKHDGNLGFSNSACELCGTHLGGDRYAATALPENMAENRDYVALEVCSHCLMWLANGELPFEE
jgi:hypothetical protein